MTTSYVHRGGLRPLSADTLGDALDRAATIWGARPALISCHQDRSYTYAELRHAANHAARALMALGVERGDRVGIWSANHAEWMITQYAAAKAGAILVNLNPAYRSRELEYALNHSGISVLITARTFRKTDYVEMLVRLMPELETTPAGAPVEAPRIPALRHVVYLGPDAGPGGIAWNDLSRYTEKVTELGLEARQAVIQFDDAVNIQFTSGTTGVPKGATLSHHNILNNGLFVGDVLHYTETDRICLPVPFFRGGENVYPREVEEFLYGHPKISEVQVIGVPDPKYGEDVCAWVRLREGATATADEIREFCCGQIATYKIPRYVRFTDEFPMTVTGKVQKFRMRGISAEELGLSGVSSIQGRLT